MKKAVITAFLLLAAAGQALAQGGVGNFVSDGAATGFGLISDQNGVLLQQGAVFSSTQWTAELIGGLSADSGSWTVLTSANTWFNFDAGKPQGGQFSVAGGGNQTLFYAVRAWDNTSGGSYGAATIRGQSVGTAQITLVSDAINPLPTPPNANTWASFQLAVIPEPSTIVLGLMGGLGLLLRRRK